MKYSDLSLTYNYKKPLIELKKNPLILMIHGYGSNEDDLFYFASYLPKEFHIVSVRGIKPMPFGDSSFSWFDIYLNNDEKKFINIEQAKESRDKIAYFIKELTEKYNIDENKIFLMGFSQGAILSFAISLTFPKLVKNIIPMSGYLNKETIDFNPKENYSHLNFFITHGTMDEVVLPKLARIAPEILKENNIKFEYKEYPMVHTISPPAFTDINNFISSVL